MGWFLPILSAIGGSVATGLFNQHSANQQMGFQENAMKNSIQWKAEDMRKAGINPILASGMNTSVPSGASAQMPDLGHSLASVMTSASAVEAVQREQDRKDAMLEFEQAFKESETALNNALRGKAEKETNELIPSQVKLNHTNAQTLRESAKKMQAEVILINQNVMESMQRIQHLREDILLLRKKGYNTDVHTELLEKQKQYQEEVKRTQEQLTRKEQYLADMEEAKVPYTQRYFKSQHAFEEAKKDWFSRLGHGAPLGGAQYHR